VSHQFDGAYCLIGRKNATFIVDDPRCSQQHALFFEGPGSKLWIRDLDSTNGTFVNGQRVVEKVLGVGDRVRVGKIEIEIASFKASREETMTQAIISPDHREESGTNTFVGPSGGDESDAGVVLHSWPENLLASPPSVQEKFIDYVDEKGEMTRIQLKNLLKAA